MNKPIRKAVIPVAGLGTRMMPATKAIPKELLPVYDQPIIEHVVKEAIAAGITEIRLVTRRGKEAIETITNNGGGSRSVKFLDYHRSSLKENCSF